MAMKTTAPAILAAFGFRRVLIYDTILSALMLAAIGFFSPSTPVILMMAVLLIGGFFRSLEFTSVNALAYAEIEAGVMSRATSFSSVVQQLSLSIGVAIGASVLQTLRWFRGGEIGIADFQWAFLIMALILLSAIGAFIGLPEGAGSDLARGSVAPGEAAADQAVASPRKPLAKT
jgi:MFS family permease